MTIQSTVRRLVIFLLAISLVAAVVLLWRTRKIATEIAKPAETEIDLGAVTTRIRSLNRLETASMHVVHVSTIKQEYKLLPNSIGGGGLNPYPGGDPIPGVEMAMLKGGDPARAPDGTTIW